MEKSQAVLYDNTGKIVSQSAKIMTSTTGTGGSDSTGKGDKRVFMENGSQKHKEKGMTEVFLEDKQKLNGKDGATTSGPSSSSAQVILKAGIGRRKLLVQPILKGNA